MDDESLPDSIWKIKKNFNDYPLCPGYPQLDFAKTPPPVKMLVFWISIPMLILNLGLLLTILYTCMRRRN